MITLPEGFEHVYNYPYPDGNTPKVVDGCAQLSNTDYVFDIDDLPKLPLRAKGKIWHKGWDIPTCYVIDVNRNSWADNAHGHQLERCQRPDSLVNLCEDDADKTRLRSELGILEPEDHLRFQIRTLFDYKNANIAEWFNRQDLNDSMRTCLLLCMQADILEFAVGPFPLGKDMQLYREFFFAVLSRKPFATQDKGIVDLVSKVAQIVGKGVSWERRDELMARVLLKVET